MPDFVNDSDLYQEIFEKEPSAIIILDERGVVCKVNQSALDMLGVE
ncbi:PAS domain S-box protein, partial [Succinivibrio sp.]